MYCYIYFYIYFYIVICCYIYIASHTPTLIYIGLSSLPRLRT